MRLGKSTLALATIAGLLLIIGPALAEDAPPPSEESPRKRERAEFCKQNPDRCEEARAKRKAFCAENPAKCEQQREQMKQRRAEFKAKCEADPEKCKQMKQQRRERFKKRQGAGNPPGEGAKPLPE